MDEPEKSHSCDAPGCNMQFEDFDHLVVHKKKHEMVLNLGNGQKNTFVADQTPTPTRFIRNCEELGLFQDLQNVNPFEETFRKAVETGKTGYGALQEGDHLHVPAGSDDTLHTPHVFPYITEDVQSSTSPVRSIISSLVPSGTTRSRSNPSDDIPVTIINLKRNEEDMIVPEISPEFSKVAVQQEVPSSLRVKQESAVEARAGGGNAKGEPAGDASAVQLLLRMSDGKLVALSGLHTAGNGLHPTVLTFAPAQSVPTQVQSVCDSMNSLSAEATTKTSVVDPEGSPQPASVSLAKLKLKEALTGISKARTKSFGTTDDSPQPSKVSIPRKAPPHKISRVADFQPSSTTLTREKKAASPEDDAAERKRKFLERNRAAAMRCREKRRSWINELQRRSRELEATNQHLQMEVAGLRAEVAQLKTLLLAHKDCPVTLSLSQGGQVTVLSAQPQQQVISVTLPAAETARGNVPANPAAPSRIVSPPARLAEPTPVVILNNKVQGQDGARPPKRRRGSASAGGAAAPPPRLDKAAAKPVAKLCPVAPQGVLVPSAPQMISVAGLQPATTFILTAAPRPEQSPAPLQVIKVNPNAAAPAARVGARPAEVDGDSDVEVVGESSAACRPDS